jgi:radical SAM protein with 4Fe4S-binding SPASM domain
LIQILEPGDLRSFRRAPRATIGHVLERIDRARRPIEHGGRILHATIETTFLCNLRCPMCSQWGTRGIGHRMRRAEVDDTRIRNPMSLEELKRLADQLAPHRASVNLIGGETFFRRDTTDFIEYLSERGLPTAFVSNGTLHTEAIIRRLGAAPYLVEAAFSVDGFGEDHDRIRGAGNYAVTMRTVERMVAAKALRTGGRPLRVKLMTTLQPANLDRLPEHVEAAKRIGVDHVQLIHLKWCSPDAAIRHHQQLFEDFGIDDRGVFSEVYEPFPLGFADRVYRTVRELRRTYGDFVRIASPDLTLEETRRYYSDLNFVIRPRCYQPWRAIWVRADGSVNFCPDQWITGFSVGNVKESPLDQIWQGDRAARFRRALNGHGLWPACARCCITNRSDS